MTFIIFIALFGIAIWGLYELFYGLLREPEEDTEAAALEELRQVPESKVAKYEVVPSGLKEPFSLAIRQRQAEVEQIYRPFELTRRKTDSITSREYNGKPIALSGHDTTPGFDSSLWNPAPSYEYKQPAYDDGPSILSTAITAAAEVASSWDSSSSSSWDSFSSSSSYDSPSGGGGDFGGGGASDWI